MSFPLAIPARLQDFPAQLPNFILKSRKLSAGDKVTFAMLLSYAWQNDFCFPGQVRLGQDLGLHETNVRKHLKSLEANGLLTIVRRALSRSRPSENTRSRPSEIVRSRPNENARSSINDMH